MSTARKKPAKPYADYPLFAHASGQWSKKIRGKQYYFGPWEDPDGSLAEYERVRHDLQMGRTPSEAQDGLDLKAAINQWLHAKAAERDNGEIKPDTWKEYQRIGKRIVNCLGGTVPIASLGPAEFTKLRSDLCSSVCAKTGKGYVVKARVFFNWCFESGNTQHPLAYRGALKAPSQSLIRREAANKPDREFSANQIRAMLEAAQGYLHPLILLGINCGLGCRDACELRWDYIKGKYLEYDRPKTGIKRKARLWDETLSALEAWRAESPDSQWVVCGLSGQQLGQGSNNTPIPHKFKPIMEAAEITGHGFYDLRRTYRTVADRTQDLVAIDLTMGHGDQTQGGQYRQRIDSDRLDKIAMTVSLGALEPASDGRVKIGQVV